MIRRTDDPADLPLANMLRATRLRHSLSLQAVANGVNAEAAHEGSRGVATNRKRVSNWEGGEVPRPDTLRWLARALSLDLEQVSRAAQEQLSRRQALRAAAVVGGAVLLHDPEPLMALMNSVVPFEIDPMGSAPRASRRGLDDLEALSDAGTVEAATEVIPRYRRLDGAVPSIELLGSVREHLLLMVRLFRAAHTPWARHRLAAAASEASSFAAWLHLDVNDLQTAQQHYRLAIDIASRSRVPLLPGYQLGSLAALVAESGNAMEALELLRAAERQLPRPAPTIARTWLWSLRATAHASAGEDLPAQRALEQASSAAEGTQNEPVWPWLTPFGPEKLTASQGVCEMRLGRPQAAVEALQMALSSSTLTIRRRGELLVYLGAAFAQRREPELTCQALGAALSIAARRRSPFLLGRVRAARGRLDRRWQNLPELADFDERLHTTWL